MKENNRFKLPIYLNIFIFLLYVNVLICGVELFAYITNILTDVYFILMIILLFRQIYLFDVRDSSSILLSKYIVSFSIIIGLLSFSIFSMMYSGVWLYYFMNSKQIKKLFNKDVNLKIFDKYILISFIMYSLFIFIVTLFI